MSETGFPTSFLFGVIISCNGIPMSLTKESYINFLSALPLPEPNFLTLDGSIISTGIDAWYNLYFNIPVFSAIWNTRPVALYAYPSSATCSQPKQLLITQSEMESYLSHSSSYGENSSP